MKRVKYVFGLFLIFILSCGEKSINSSHGYGKVRVRQGGDSTLISGANVKIYNDSSTVILQGLTDINGEFEFEMETPQDTNVDVYSLYEHIGNQYLATTMMVIHPGDTTEVDIFGY